MSHNNLYTFNIIHNVVVNAFSYHVKDLWFVTERGTLSGRMGVRNKNQFKCMYLPDLVTGGKNFVSKLLP